MLKKMPRPLLSFLPVIGMLLLTNVALAQSFGTSNDVGGILTEGIQACGIEAQLRQSRDGSAALHRVRSLKPEAPSSAKLDTINQLRAALVVPGADICLSQYLNEARETAAAN